MSVAFIYKDEEGADLDMVPAGHEEIVRFIRSIEGGYRGALVICNPGEIESLGKLAADLCRFRKPVVLLDISDTGEDIARGIGTAGGFFYRAHLDEKGAVGCAARSLVEKGHRHIAIPYIEDSPGAWIGRRIENMTEAMRVLDPASRIAVRKLAHPFWSTRHWEDIHHLVSEVEFHIAATQKDGLPGITKSISTQRLAAEYGHELLSLLDESAATAIAAPNDLMAREYYFLLTSIGAKIPQDISLVAFDNNMLSSMIPLCTVDFGFAQLGYLCAHIFIDDFRVPIGPDRAIPGKCRLINRGSLGKAREGRSSGV